MGGFPTGQDAVDQYEQQAGTRDPVEILRPGGGGVGAAQQPVHQGTQVDDKTGIMDDPPGLFLDPLADIESQHDEEPGIEPELAECHPGRAVLDRPKGQEQLHQGVVAVLITQQDQGVEASEEKTEQARVLVDGHGGREARPDAGHLVGDPDPKHHRYPQQAHGNEPRPARKIPVRLWVGAGKRAGEPGQPERKHESRGDETAEDGQQEYQHSFDSKAGFNLLFGGIDFGWINFLWMVDYLH